jgi:outer membrane murein-binding lipoprotein Lpp
MGILDEAIREIRLEKQAAEDDARQAMEDFDMITSRAVDAVKNTVAALRSELQAANWWSEELREDSKRPEYLSLSFRVRRHAEMPDSAANPDYSYSIRFDALGGAIRITDSIDPLLEPLEFRGVARQDFGTDLEKDLKLFLKAILYRH